MSRLRQSELSFCGSDRHPDGLKPVRGSVEPGLRAE
jgi:hypothetical protein